LIFNQKVIEVGLAATPFIEHELNEDEVIDKNKVYMLFIKDEDNIPETQEAKKFNTDKDMPYFILFVINFLTLVLALIFMNICKFALNKFLFDIVFKNAGGEISAFFSWLYYV